MCRALRTHNYRTCDKTQVLLRSVLFNKLYKLQTLLDTANEFMKLEKIEFGGIKGKQLSSQVESMFVEFQGLYKVRIYSQISYNSIEFALQSLVYSCSQYNEIFLWDLDSYVFKTGWSKELVIF